MANNWAIVVGINTYKFLPKASLKFAEQDALAMQQFLCEEAEFAADHCYVAMGLRRVVKPLARYCGKFC
jgi:uncharacterized caspase-like protein